MRRLAKVWLSALMLTASGCSAIHDSIIDMETQTRNLVLAQKAWGEWSWCYDDLEYPYHFAKGFKAGYRDILDGGKGCQPTLPPKCYWKPYYQSPEGRCQIAAWFDGFSHGALAAEQDGYGNIGQLPISPTARANMISKKAPVNPACFDGMYRGPIPEAVDMSDEEAAPLVDLPGEMPPGRPAEGQPLELVDPEPAPEKIPYDKK